MGRKDTFKRSKTSVFDSMLDEPLSVDNITVSDKNEDVEKAAVEIVEDLPSKKFEKPKVEMPKRKKKATKKIEQNEFVKKPTFGKKKSETISRSFTIPRELSEIIDAAVKDKNGERIAGSYGFIKNVVTNGIIKELIELEILEDDYINNLYDYE